MNVVKKIKQIVKDHKERTKYNNSEFFYQKMKDGDWKLNKKRFCK